MTSSSHKMDVVITALVFLVLTVRCMGSDPEGTNLSHEYKRKVFDIFNRTSQYDGEHAKLMKYQWNQENPSQKVLDHRKLHKYAWSVIEEKCKDCEHQTGLNRGNTRKILSQIYRETARENPENKRLLHETLLSRHPEYQNLSRDLTWSLVHDWHKYYAEDVVPRGVTEWTPEMKASLLYIRDQARKEGKETWKEIRRRWILLYPQYHLRVGTLDHSLRELDATLYKPTRDVMRKAKQRYDSSFSPEEGKEKKKGWKWTPQMLTDLMYIATRLDARDRLFNQKLKRRWDQMNDLYSYMSENNLLLRLHRLRVDRDFQPKPIYVQRAKMRYENLTPIDETTLINVPVHESEKTVKFLREYRGIIDEFIENMDSHDVSGHRTGSHPSSPQHSHSEHYPGETSPRHDYQQPEFTPDPTAPIHPPPSVPEFGYPSEYGMYYHPNMSGFDVGASSSTPHPTQGRQSPGGRISQPHDYYQPELTQNLSLPIHSPPFFPEFSYFSDYGMHFDPNVSGQNVGAPSSSSHPTHSGHSPGGETFLPHKYHQPELTQNLSAPIHSPPFFPEFGYPPDYDTPYYPNVNAHDIGASPSTPHTSRRGLSREGETSSFHEHQQPGFSRDPSASTHHPRDPTEVTLPPRYSAQTFSSVPPFDPQSHTPRPRHGEGSSAPKVRRRRS